MKRKVLSFVLILIGMLVLLCACGAQPSVEGEELIKKAREDYKNLKSAKVIMTNTETDEVEQTFEFKYDEKGFLTYSYEGKNGDDVYAQYNNSVESFTYQNGKFEYLQKGDDSFEVYSKDVTHPQADEGLIIFNASAVSEASKSEKNGVTDVHHEYNVDKLEASEDLTEFLVDYYFDKDDNLLYFVECSKINEDGTEQLHSYKVEITEKNAVDKVENTVEKYKN